ncbi:hypothetical protein SY2F82_67750 [Streptomyces sp. Y2F8-2]|nr:hypothetical protein SY2F82_67750 [Streptomyces sp. Y2F8-2]
MVCLVRSAGHPPAPHVVLLVRIGLVACTRHRAGVRHDEPFSRMRVRGKRRYGIFDRVISIRGFFPYLELLR